MSSFSATSLRYRDDKSSGFFGGGELEFILVELEVSGRLLYLREY